MGTILGIVASIVVGGSVAAATIVGVVNSQTAEPEKSPVSVSEVGIEYGSN